MIREIWEVKPNEWVNLEVEVIELWDNNHPSIRQVGLVGDESGIMKLVSWEKSNLPLLQEGHKYRLTKVVISEYDGRIQGALNRKSTITPINDGQTTLPVV